MKTICEIAHIDTDVNGFNASTTDKTKMYYESIIGYWVKYEYENGRRLFLESSYGVIHDDRKK